MADNSKIEWCDATWNPIVGCSVVSPGCTNCYAMKWAFARLDQPHNQFPHYRGTTARAKTGGVWTGKVAPAPDHILTAPLRWKKPRRIFVNSMGDLFHEAVPDEWIDRVFAVMTLAPQHTFLVLTKRASRMREYLSDAARLGDQLCRWAGSLLGDRDPGEAPDWPLANVWLGVSVEDQARADERIPELLATPAAVHFISAEPLLGPLDLTSVDIDGHGTVDALCPETPAEIWLHDWDPAMTGTSLDEAIDGFTDCGFSYPPTDHPVSAGLDWVIIGGESGPGARPMHPDWARLLRDQCAAAGVRFFFKQWGEWGPYDRGRTDGAVLATPYSTDEPLQKFGKSRAGRLLDGSEHSEFPA